ncbi:MAG: hypothetical protein IT378_08160 [Sandaracinaceae bacterium]|nr:hypothetical protein [Sandaracinaceae bacterium]
MLLFNHKIYSAMLSGSSFDYSPPETWELLGSATDLCVQIRAAQANETFDIKTDFEHSADGLVWEATGNSDAFTVDDSQVFSRFISWDASRLVQAPRYRRLRVWLVDVVSTEAVHLEIWAAGRGKAAPSALAQAPTAKGRPAPGVSALATSFLKNVAARPRCGRNAECGCGGKDGPCACGNASKDAPPLDLSGAVLQDLIVGGGCPRDVPNCARSVFETIRAWANSVWPQLGPDHRIDPRTGNYWQNYLEMTPAERDSPCGGMTCGELALCGRPHWYLTERNAALHDEFMRLAQGRCRMSESEAQEQVLATRERTRGLELCLGGVHRYLETPPPATVRVDLCHGNRIRFTRRELMPRPSWPQPIPNIVEEPCRCTNCGGGYRDPPRYNGCEYTCQWGRVLCDCRPNLCPQETSNLGELRRRCSCISIWP